MIENVVNAKLLSHPVNWLVVWTVLLFAGMAITLAHDALFVTSTTTGDS